MLEANWCFPRQNTKMDSWKWLENFLQFRNDCTKQNHGQKYQFFAEVEVVVTIKSGRLK